MGADVEFRDHEVDPAIVEIRAIFRSDGLQSSGKVLVPLARNVVRYHEAFGGQLVYGGREYKIHICVSYSTIQRSNNLCSAKWIVTSRLSGGPQRHLV